MQAFSHEGRDGAWQAVSKESGALKGEGISILSDAPAAPHLQVFRPDLPVSLIATDYARMAHKRQTMELIDRKSTTPRSRK